MSSFGRWPSLVGRFRQNSESFISRSTKIPPPAGKLRRILVTPPTNVINLMDALIDAEQPARTEAADRQKPAKQPERRSGRGVGKAGQDRLPLSRSRRDLSEAMATRKQLKAAVPVRVKRREEARRSKGPRKKRTRPEPRQYTVADLERARDRVEAAERRVESDRANKPHRGRAGLQRARLELHVIESKLRARGLF